MITKGSPVIAVVIALLGGGGIMALIQMFLLPRTIEKAKADTSTILVGTARETVQLVKGELDRSQQEITDLRTQLAEARGRMSEQDEQINEQRRHIRTLTSETEDLRARVGMLESRVRAATDAMDGLENGGS